MSGWFGQWYCKAHVVNGHTKLETTLSSACCISLRFVENFLFVTHLQGPLYLVVHAQMHLDKIFDLDASQKSQKHHLKNRDEFLF